MQKNKKVIYQDLGLIDYADAWKLQEEIFANTVNIKVLNRRDRKSVV